MIRDARRSDTSRLFALMMEEFPEESALLGGRPEEFEKIVRRVLRWDTRIIVGLFRLFGRPIFRLLIVEVDGQVAGTTMVSFPRKAAYVSNVVVDPSHRRQGCARQMLDEARQTARRTGRRFMVLDVLDTNAAARTLYDSYGFRPLRARAQFVCEPTAKVGTAPPASSAIRPFRRPDATALAEIVRRQTPPPVEAVLPSSERQFLGSALEDRMLASESAAWVIDRGHGPEGHVAATVSEMFEAAQMAAPVVAESADTDLAEALVRTAGAWCAARKTPRILSMVAEDNTRGRAALEAAGFQHAFALWTLYRNVD